MHDTMEGLAKAARMTSEQAGRWAALSAAVVEARLRGDPIGVNQRIEYEIKRADGHPVALGYKYWAAENLMFAGHASKTVSALDSLIGEAEHNKETWLPIDPMVIALRRRVDALWLARDWKATAAAATEMITAAGSGNPGLALEAARIVENLGDTSEAERLYRRVIAESAGSDTARTPLAAADETLPSMRDAARRDLERLLTPRDLFLNVEGLAQVLADAVASNDHKQLARLASRSHFALSVGAHAIYVETDALLERFARALGRPVPDTMELVGRGRHFRLVPGWLEAGTPLRFVEFVLRRNARGWEWTGLSVADLEYWLPDLPHASPETNQPLDMRPGLHAPWPAGRKFMAGGFRNPWHGFVAGTSLDPVTLLIRSCSSDCGFGVRGFYYNAAFSHNGPDAFAIDFTSYQRCIPFANRADGYPVLAPARGVVLGVRDRVTSGDDSAANVVEIIHLSTAGTCRYLSRYLHLAGPMRVPVSAVMFVPTGTTLGFMDDTGNSATSHLHFSIHDQDRGPHPDAAVSSVSPPIRRGPSVRPTPMAGQRLDDADEARCVESTLTGVRPTVAVRAP